MLLVKGERPSPEEDEEARWDEEEEDGDEEEEEEDDGAMAAGPGYKPIELLLVLCEWAGGMAVVQHVETSRKQSNGRHSHRRASGEAEVERRESVTQQTRSAATERRL